MNELQWNMVCLALGNNFARGKYLEFGKENAENSKSLNGVWITEKGKL